MAALLWLSKQDFVVASLDMLFFTELNEIIVGFSVNFSVGLDVFLVNAIITMLWVAIYLLVVVCVVED